MYNAKQKQCHSLHRSQFVQSLLLSTLSHLHIGELAPEPAEEAVTTVEQQLPTTVDVASNTANDDADTDDDCYDHRNETIAAAEQSQLQHHQLQQQQQFANDYDCEDMQTPQRYAGAQHYTNRTRLDATAKLKSASGVSGKPPPPAQARAQAATVQGRPPAQQQQQQKSRELKTAASAAAVAAKDTHDSSR